MAHPQRGRELQAGEIVQLGKQQGGPLALGDPGQRTLEVARQAALQGQVLG